MLVVVSGHPVKGEGTALHVRGGLPSTNRSNAKLYKQVTYHSTQAKAASSNPQLPQHPTSHPRQPKGWQTHAFYSAQVHLQADASDDAAVTQSDKHESTRHTLNVLTHPASIPAQLHPPNPPLPIVHI